MVVQIVTEKGKKWLERRDFKNAALSFRMQQYGKPDTLPRTSVSVMQLKSSEL